MKDSIASAPPRTWNKKNLPSEIERFGGRSGKAAQTLRAMPSAAYSFARRRPGMVVTSLVAAIASVGIIWYLARRE